MISLLNDYAEGCHPRILQRLSETNTTQAAGYGEDPWTAQARDLIEARLGRPNAQVHFLPGGTLTNAVALSASLRPYQAVIAADTGHIVRHEAGAIEATGHRVITTEGAQGKLCPASIGQAMRLNQMAPHMAEPKMVYVSQSTELGTVYARSELTEISRYCRAHDLLLFVDGARLANALVASDLGLVDLAELCDLFWIGGTKAGGLLGEALVIPNPQAAPGLATIQKQRGGLLAKGRVVGLSFVELLQDDLYLELATHANDMAQALARGIEAHGASLHSPCVTNQVFADFEDATVMRLTGSFLFHRWGVPKPGVTTIRLVTSWATTRAHIDAFVAELRKDETC